MRKITDFIVNKRHFILILFIVFAVISAVLSTKVNVNYDISKYLPSDSETRIGMDIMENEFKELNTSSLNVMFKGIENDEKKQEIYTDLTKINGVDEVEYDNTEKHNKDDYTLYEITVSDNEDSELATAVYNKITNDYKDYEIYTSGAVSERNNPVLPTWIVVLAVFCALIILIIMCESYVEPFLFLATILMGVLLNKGTNVIFESVSNITDSISAILQMALSMDYSIMLMNRYRQERNVENDKVKAMKNALYNAFKSISSSSVTTIVGLIALVFMSFTIGKDLGFVLAKGVLFSLISIFFVLPALILIFDKTIAKTKKKSPNIKLDRLGKISYKCRYIAVPVFLLVFLASYLIKGNLGIVYSNTEDDKISEVFTENNQMAIIYKTEDEEKIAKYLNEIEQNENIDEVLGYGNTINEKLKYDELNEKLNDLGSDVEVDDYLLKILYYKYFNPEEDNTMTFNEFVTFIKNEVYNNENASKKLDDETKNNIERLENFTNETLINKNRTGSEIAELLEINEEDVEDLLIYYNSKNNNIKMSITDFVNFMNKDVLTNNKYSNGIDASSKQNLNTLSKFTSKSTIQTKITSNQMANLFGIDENMVKDLYTYYINVNDINTKMTISEFSNFVLNNVVTNSQYANNFNSETISNIKMLATFSNKDVISKESNSSELSNLFGINEDLVNQLLFLKYGNTENNSKNSLSDFIVKIINIKNNSSYLKDTDLSDLEKMYVFAQNQNNINTTKMDKNALSKIFDNINEGLVTKVYIGAGLPDEYLLTPQEFVNLVISNFSSSMDSDIINKLNLLKMVIDDSVSDSKKEYTATELSKLLNINSNQMYQLYGLIDLTTGNTSNWKITPKDFVDLILQNIENENIKNNIDSATIEKLTLLSKIMNSSLNGESYSYNELSSLIGIDINTVKNVYTLYVLNTSNLKLTPLEFVNFVLNQKNDEMLSSKLSSSTLKSLETIQTVMNSVINNKTYNSSELSNILGIDTESMQLLYGLYNVKYINTNPTISLNNFVNFLLNDVITNEKYSSNFDAEKISKLNTIKGIMNVTANNTKYTKDEIFIILSQLTDNIEKDTIDVVYTYYGSENEYDESWELTVEEFVGFLNEDILNDSRFDDFIENDMRENIIESKDTVNDAKDLLIGNGYSRVVINTSFDKESEETFNFIQKVKDDLGEECYIIGDSPMSYEMSQTFNDEMNFITILTMIAIFIVVAITFKSFTIPLILVLTIQCAVYMTMGILSFTGENVYFISLLIVQSILMGATIDYAILYTSYYIENRKSMNIKESIINSYNKSIHTILTSASILIIVTLIVGNFASAIAAKICKTISQGTLCSTILILVLLPAVIAAFDRFVVNKK